MKFFKYTLTISCMALIGCGGQTPAPVVTGFPIGVQTQSSQTKSQAYIPSSSKTLYHTVQKGDTLWAVAQRYKTTTADLIALNSLGSSVLYVGQRLKVYEEAPLVKEEAPSGKFTDRIAQEKSTEPEQTKPQEKAIPEVVKTAAPSYTYHRVRSGENLFRIGLKFGVSPLDLMAENDLKKPEDLQAGSVIKVPVVGQTQTPVGTQEERQVNEALARSRGFVWPAKGKILNQFGKQEDGVVNNGIKIKLAENTPIHAAESGMVIYADDGLKTYGNLILLRHNNGLITAYGHNSQNLVKRHDSVKKGEVIAFAGVTGNVNTPQLHFEVRRNARAVDPLKVLPR